LLVVVLAAAGGGVVIYRQLNGNITKTDLYTGASGNAGTEPEDPFGRTPLNVLVIGSDTRDSAADCKLGGACQDDRQGRNADVEMLVHLAADRSNMTVMSVPRDTVTALPACRDSAAGTQVAARTGQINGTLAYGAGCTVAAVHKLTGVPIDHVAVIDFSGVVTMSDAVGGVPVCVSDDVYDTYSHLRLSKGKHTLKGTAALEFVRSRHGFGDGSDLGRTYAQHAFLASAIRTVKSTGVLLNPAALYELGQAATRALTVDKGIGSVSKLVSLASELNKVPSGRVTFTTMQTTPDPADVDRVIVAPAAKRLFKKIIDDTSLSTAKTATPSSTSTQSSTSTPSPSATKRSALEDAHAQTASADSCVPVSHEDTVVLNGVPMTPVEAFHASTSVRVSAP
jgi:LCP family protein required for cell wall assembly